MARSVTIYVVTYEENEENNMYLAQYGKEATDLASTARQSNSIAEQAKITAANFLAIYQSPEVYLSENYRERSPDRVRSIKVLLTSIDIYTQVPLIETLICQVAQRLPCFLVHLPGPAETVVDAKSFLKDAILHNQKRHPLTREPVVEFNLYKSCQKKPTEFKLVCRSEHFPGPHAHWLKFINACSCDLSKVELGQEQFYLAVHYEKLATANQNLSIEPSLATKKIARLSKAKFWLDLAAKNEFPEAYLKLATWHSMGNAIVPVDFKKVKKYFQAYLHTAELKDGRILPMCATYRQLLTGFKREVEKEIEGELHFCTAAEYKHSQQQLT